MQNIETKTKSITLKCTNSTRENSYYRPGLKGKLGGVKFSSPKYIVVWAAYISDIICNFKEQWSYYQINNVQPQQPAGSENEESSNGYLTAYKTLIIYGSILNLSEFFLFELPEASDRSHNILGPKSYHVILPKKEKKNHIM